MPATKDSKEAKYEALYGLVGMCLSNWAAHESRLADSFCALVCAEGTPTDGALATYFATRGFRQRTELIYRTFNQVLFHSEFDEPRKELRKALDRLLEVASTRNKIAHGIIIQLDTDEEPFLYPYYVNTINIRHNFLRESGFHEGRIESFKKWNEEAVADKLESIWGAQEHVIQIENLILNAFAEGRNTLLKTPRAMQASGLPFFTDRSDA